MRFAATFSHGLFASLLLAGGLAHAALQPGDAAPDFEAEAALAGKGYTFQLKAARQAGPVVVYFYPSAYTNGCNIQAHSFATQLDAFKAAGASVVGVSLDSIGRLREFSADPDYCAGKLSVASDADGRIAKAFALNVREAPTGRKDSRGQDIDHGLAERTTFIVGKDGRIAATVGGLSPIENVEQALLAVQQLAAKR
ncbi:peroxiredoxin [Pelomonas sp. BJYL3]|uniref:peroxiredoxin n=1 Tax=Pelomonas sp. BJYL3 TaxID=2976697 RepID=UPI0022B2D0ED|nr:peroxiredoxin [Pelomonas sp. BJYL3]